jgi:hypothetical protein
MFYYNKKWHEKHHLTEEDLIEEDHLILENEASNEWMV